MTQYRVKKECFGLKVGELVGETSQLKWWCHSFGRRPLLKYNVNYPEDLPDFFEKVKENVEDFSFVQDGDIYGPDEIGDYYIINNGGKNYRTLHGRLDIEGRSFRDRYERYFKKLHDVWPDQVVGNFASHACTITPKKLVYRRMSVDKLGISFGEPSGSRVSFNQDTTSYNFTPKPKEPETRLFTGAPAYYGQDGKVFVSRRLYESEAEAQASLRGKTFIGWPAMPGDVGWGMYRVKVPK